MQSSTSKRKNSSSTTSSTTTGEHSKKLLKPEGKSDLGNHNSIHSKSSDEVKVLPNFSDRLSKLESELVDLKKELVELKDENKKTILKDDAYQMRSFWNSNRQGLECFIAKRIAECNKVVLNCTRDFSSRMRTLEKQIIEVRKKEDARTDRLDALIEKEKDILV